MTETAAGATGRRSPATGSRRWAALILLALAEFVLTLDAAIVGVATPTLTRELHFAPGDISWIINAYTLLFGGFLLLGGRICDLTSPRAVFIVGALGFAAASAAGGAAQSAGMLIAARAGQGLAAAFVSPAALALLLTTFTDSKERGRALGVWGAVGVAGGAAGFILGGVLTELVGWRSVLYVNVPIGILAAVLAPILLLPRGPAGGRRTYDFAGAALVTGGLGLILYALVKLPESGAGPGLVGVLVLGVLLVGAFVLVERRSERPLVPLGIFRIRSMRGANLTILFVASAMMPSFFLLALYTQNVLEYRPIVGGLAQLPVAVGVAAATMTGAALVMRFGPKLPVVVTLTVFALALLWFSRVSAGGSFLGDIVGPSILFSAVGVAWVALLITATSEAPEGQTGLVAGLMNTTVQIGGALGVGLLISVAATRTGDAMAAGEPITLALNEGYQLAFLCGAGAAVIAALVGALLVPRRLTRSASSTADGDEEVAAPAAPGKKAGEAT